MPDPLERIIVRMLEAQKNVLRPMRNQALAKWFSSSGKVLVTDTTRGEPTVAYTAICGIAVSGRAECGDGPAYSLLGAKCGKAVSGWAECGRAQVEYPGDIRSWMLSGFFA